MAGSRNWSPSRRALITRYQLFMAISACALPFSCLVGAGVEVVAKAGGWSGLFACFFWPLVFFVFTGGLVCFFMFWNIVRTLRAAHEGAEYLRLAMKNNALFAMYVRPFASEAEEDVLMFAPYTEMIAQDMLDRKLDGDAALRVLPRLRALLPIFALLNPRGGRLPAATCIDTLDEDWESLFRGSSYKACVMIVGSGNGEDSAAFATEITHICDQDMLDKTMVLVNSESNILGLYPELAKARWIIHAPAHDFAVPVELEGAVRAMTTQPASPHVTTR